MVRWMQRGNHNWIFYQSWLNTKTEMICIVKYTFIEGEGNPSNFFKSINDSKRKKISKGCQKTNGFINWMQHTYTNRKLTVLVPISHTFSSSFIFVTVPSCIGRHFKWRILYLRFVRVFRYLRKGNVECSLYILFYMFLWLK